ncbi:uncharacterized protein LOC126734088 [Anthonomus grandis grandis]|uniref:uncharacterized protein LOC126734088 n=1 Tax=Anthonomus grandis grandis TaxID=2921223 RepID=UPI0021665B2A|nr:uncharacterized protein LOC126734088 [Anthonomus grandis grandis]
MSKKSFDELLSVLKQDISRRNTTMRTAISAEERLTITLRYLSTGNSFAALQFEFNIARCTIGKIIREVCRAIWTCLKDREMPEPTTEMWLDIADKFYMKTDFPNCVGAIDGKHIRCINPHNSGSNYFNYKKYFSVVLMAVVDANLSFIAINVGAYGKEGDSTVFRDSPLGKKLYSGALNLPPPRCLPNIDDNPQPFVMVGDEAFKISSNLLRPYPSRNLTPCKRVFNYRLSRCRRTVECAFGVLSNKWRVFHSAILVQPEFIDDIVKACCILHNYVRKRDGINFEDMDTYSLSDIDNFGESIRGQGLDIRDYFANYFMGPGAVSFQDKYMY